MGSSDSVIVFQDWDSLVAAVALAREEGWEVEGADVPEAGKVSFAARKDGPEARELTWWPYGRELSPKVVVCSTWEEFISELELRRTEPMEKADDLSKMQVGFAAYGRAHQGICEVVRIGVPELQAGGAEARRRLIAVLVSAKHPGAAELQAALQGRD